jgi:PAS domain-containing protein
MLWANEVLRKSTMYFRLLGVNATPWSWKGMSHAAKNILSLRSNERRRNKQYLSCKPSRTNTKVSWTFDAHGFILHRVSTPLKEPEVQDHRRIEDQLAGEKQLLEMIASGRSLSEVLTALCEFVKEIAGCHCGVYQIDWNGPIFTKAVAPSLPSSYLAPIEGWPVRRDVAPCGVAANDRKQVIVEDISTDLRWSATSYEQHVLAHGLRSVWSTPIFSRGGQVLGTFCVYQGHPGPPTQFQLDLIDQVTHIASIAIERALSEEALTRSERELKLIVDTIPAMAWSARPDGTGEFFNQHYLDYVGLSLEQARDWGWTAALHPG